MTAIPWTSLVQKPFVIRTSNGHAVGAFFNGRKLRKIAEKYVHRRKKILIPFREKIGIDFEIFAYKRSIGLWMLILFFGTINQSYLTYWIFELNSGTVCHNPCPIGDLSLFLKVGPWWVVPGLVARGPKARRAFHFFWEARKCPSPRFSKI